MGGPRAHPALNGHLGYLRLTAVVGMERGQGSSKGAHERTVSMPLALALVIPTLDLIFSKLLAQSLAQTISLGGPRTSQCQWCSPRPCHRAKALERPRLGEGPFHDGPTQAPAHGPHYLVDLSPWLG